MAHTIGRRRASETYPEPRGPGGGGATGPTGNVGPTGPFGGATGPAGAVGPTGPGLPSSAGHSPGDVLQLDASLTPIWGAVPTALTITSFATGRSILRAGATLANPTFTASYNQTPTTVTIQDDQGNPSSAFGVSPFTSGTYLHSYTKTAVASVTYTLAATRTVGGTTTATAVDRWGFDVYHGAAAAVTTEANIKALATDVLSQSKSVPNYPAVSTGTDYDWFCMPTSFGTPAFTDVTTGFPVPFVMTGTVSVTNSNSVTVNYDIWRSANPGIGTAGTVVIHVS